jgi:hypothetical protein
MYNFCMKRFLHGNVFIFLFLFILVYPIAANSQLRLPIISPSISFVLTPENPKPRDSVNVKIESFSVDLDLSSIDWFVNGVRVANGNGLDSITTKLDEVGSETVVSVVIRPDEITEILEQISIIPSYVSIIWEADTYTPPFFRGRSLPSSGTNIHTEADAIFVKSDGNTVSNSDLIFTWKKDGAIIKNSSGRGKSSMTFAGPLLYGENIISVDVVSTDNKFSSSALVRIPSVEPYLTLYKDDPLLGIMYHQALTEKASIPGSDIILAAIPFYTSIKNPSDSRMSYTWEVNNQNIETDPNDPFRIVLRLAGGLVGTANVSLIISHLDDFLQSADKMWSLTISEESIEQGDPFFRSVN